MSRKKSSSIVKIPVHRDTGNVPHWIGSGSASDLQNNCESKLKEFQERLEQGYTETEQRWAKSEKEWRRWVESRIDEFNYEWRDPWEFNDTYQITDYGKGQSAAYFCLRSLTSGALCIMFLSDAMDLIANATLVEGVVTGRWMFHKKGQNFGIKYLGGVVAPADKNPAKSLLELIADRPSSWTAVD